MYTYSEPLASTRSERDRMSMLAVPLLVGIKRRNATDGDVPSTTTLKTAQKAKYKIECGGGDEGVER